MKILIADDHAVVRQGLSKILSNESRLPDVDITEVESGQEVIQAINTQDWDMIVLDLNFPDKNGLELLSEIKGLRPNLPVIVLSFFPEEQYGLRVLRAGGSGYLTKEMAPEELVDCIKKVSQGGIYVSQKLAQQLADVWGGDKSNSPSQLLSDRELQVLTMMTQGKTPTEIGDRLCLSVKTISTYRARLLEKLGLQTTADLIRFGIENKLAS